MKNHQSCVLVNCAELLFALQKIERVNNCKFRPNRKIV